MMYPFCPTLLEKFEYLRTNGQSKVDFIHFFVLLWTNGHQKEPIFALLTADCRPGMLNGYAPEYVINVSG